MSKKTLLSVSALVSLMISSSPAHAQGSFSDTYLPGVSQIGDCSRNALNCSKLDRDDVHYAIVTTTRVSERKLKFLREAKAERDPIVEKLLRIAQSAEDGSFKKVYLIASEQITISEKSLENFSPDSKLILLMKDLETLLKQRETTSNLPKLLEELKRLSSEIGEQDLAAEKVLESYEKNDWAFTRGFDIAPYMSVDANCSFEEKYVFKAHIGSGYKQDLNLIGDEALIQRLLGTRAHDGVRVVCGPRRDRTFGKTPPMLEYDAQSNTLFSRGQTVGSANSGTFGMTKSYMRKSGLSEEKAEGLRRLLR